MTKVIVVGAGFGGLTAARRLAKHKSSIDLTVIDERNHHLFQPLLYQVAMAGLSPAEIAAPIRSILSRRHRHVEVLMGKVTGVDFARSQIERHGGEPLHFDYLVLACGATHS